MQRLRTGLFLPSQAAGQKTLVMWEIPEAYGEMGYTTSNFRYRSTELPAIHPEVPNSSFKEGSKMCEKGLNSVILMVVQTAPSRARHTCKALEALGQQLRSWSRRATPFEFHALNLD